MTVPTLVVTVVVTVEDNVGTGGFGGADNYVHPSFEDG